MKKLGDRKIQNIFKLECDEIVSGTGESVIFLKVFNSFSPQSSSFFNSAFLDFYNRNPVTSQSSF
jgi:hypothetical protein